jgi:hypothetical protein
MEDPRRAMKNSEELRQEARRLRGLAEHNKYPDMGDALREIAREYDRMADRAEEHEILG